MAVAGVSLSLDTSELLRLQESLGKVFDNAGLADILGDALEKALEPAKLRLRENTPAGPTGNLKRAVNTKIVRYKRDGNAVGLLGYNRAGKGDSKEIAHPGTVRLGPDRAFHQWLVEFGTKQRPIKTIANKPYQRRAHTRTMKSGKVAQINEHTVKAGQGSMIASSIGQRGAFAITKSGQGITTPKGTFFKKGKKGETLVINAMQAGGYSEPPLRKTWREYQGKVATTLQQELRISLERALDSLTYSSTGSVTSATIQAGG
jgi:hypothetical protein